MEDLIEAFEAAGIVFLQPREGEHGVGVAYKWGAQLPQETPGTRAGPAQSGGLKAAWDGPGEDTAPLDAELVEWWATQPELWDSLSPLGREALSRKMFGHPHA